MANAASLVIALKRALKASGLTYRDVATALDLSEASVKRLFSERDFTLRRLERICELMDITISDLVKIAGADKPYTQELTEDQEKQLVSDKKVLLTAVLALSNWTYEEILEHFRLSEHELIRALARLDRLKLIELLPKNRIKLLVAPNFRWRKYGPIEKFFTQNVSKEYLRRPFNQPGEALVFQYGMLSKSSSTLIERRLRQVAKEFNDLHQEDLEVPLKDRRGRIMILAIRSWALSVFDEFRRTTDTERP